MVIPIFRICLLFGIVYRKRYVGADETCKIDARLGNAEATVVCGLHVQLVETNSRS